MPIETLQPDAVGPVDDWGLGAGPSKQAATQLPDDDDTSYILGSIVGDIQEFECDDPIGILAADTINQVNLKYRAKYTGVSASATPGLRVGGGTLGEGAQQVLTTAYVDYNDIFAKNPDGVNWSLADLKPLRLRVRVAAVSFGAVRVTTLIVEVSYTRASDKSQHTMLLGVG